MAEITLTLDRRDLARFRTLLKANRTIAAQSLTFTAEKAAPAWRAGHGIFHRRNTWIDRGVRVRAATAGNLTAHVGTVDKYMGRHIEGLGESKASKNPIRIMRAKRRLRVSGGLFVPHEEFFPLTHTKILGKLRRMYGTKTKPFWIIGHGGTPLLVRRLGKGRSPLRVLAHRRESVEIAPRLDAVGIVRRVVRREYPRVYERLLLKWAATK